MRTLNSAALVLIMSMAAAPVFAVGLPCLVKCLTATMRIVNTH